MLSRRAAYPSTKCPQLARAPARASSSSTWYSAGASSRSSRNAPPNQRAALSGARWTVSSPAWCRVATASWSPFRPERSTWWARSEAVAPLAARADALHLVGAQPPSGWSRLVDGPAHDRVPEPEPARGSGLPDEGRPRQLVEGGERVSSTDARAAAAHLRFERVADHGCSLEHQVRGVGQAGELLREGGRHDRWYVQRLRQPLVHPGPGAAVTQGARPAARGRTDCRHSRRTGPTRPRPSTESPSSCSASSRVMAPSAMRANVSAPCDRWISAVSRSKRRSGRRASATSTPASGGRRSSPPRSSTDAGSAQWKSSRTRTRGRVAASRSSSPRTARWVR